MQIFTNLFIPFYKDIKEFILDTLFPISCLACETEGKEFLCSDCASKLPKVHQICIMCHKPSPGGLTHPNCKSQYSPEGLISLLDYHDERVSKLIIHGKYYFVKDIYKTLGKMLANEIKTKHPHLTTTNYQLTPIPLHFTRQNWRGFNQAEILCQSLGKQLNLPIAPALIRKKSTKTQKDLKKEQRLLNVRDSFAVSPNVKSSRLPAPESAADGGQLNIQSLNCILVDDVTTTGATLQEAAKVLKRNGAAKVFCLTVARD